MKQSFTSKQNFDISCNFWTVLFTFLFLFIGLKDSLKAAEWQWSVPLKGMISTETNDHPQAFLWIPSNCKQVRGVVVGQHNMLEEGIFEHQAFRKTLSGLGFAEIWVSPNFSVVFDHQGEAEKVFNEMMQDLAEVSGYDELSFAPIVPLGHSALASFPWNFGAALPQRTLAMISIHGDSPLTNMTGSGRPNPDWGTKNIDGIPGLIVIGEYEWLEGRIVPAMAFKKNYPKSCVALLADAGRGHFDYSDNLINFLGMFLRKAVKERLPVISPKQEIVLKPVDPEQGWLIDRWRKDEHQTVNAAPFSKYSGNKYEAFWAFDKEMAEATEAYYNKARGKKSQFIGFLQNDKLLDGAGSFVGYRLKFNPKSNDLTFNVSTAFIDTIQGKNLSLKHAASKIRIERICGPVQKINDTTFKIAFYRMGLNNPKRTGDIWLIASNDGDKTYKSAVQQANFKIPINNMKGEEQTIRFNDIENQKEGIGSISLVAASSANVPVNFYIKEGPAELDGNILRFTKVPPKAKFPVKVTVVAWQWGRNAEPLLQSAKPVEKTFYIIK